MSMNYSALWSSLRTLELIRPYTSTTVEPAKAYSIFYGDINHSRKHYFRLQNLASGLALIGATSSDAMTVTACSVEVSYPDPERRKDLTIILRIAQNKLIHEAEISKLQSLVDRLVKEISAYEKSLWDAKNTRIPAIRCIVRDVLLPLAIERCRDKVSHILNGPYSKSFREWYAKIDPSKPLVDAAGPPHKMLLHGLQFINNCSSDDVSNPMDAGDVGAMVISIEYATAILNEFGDALEGQWKVYDSKISYDHVVADAPQDANEEGLEGDSARDVSEDDDDRESLDLSEIKKSSIHRFFRKLERYFVACSVVTSELVHLVRSGAVECNVTVEMVPISTTTSTPANQNEYLSCKDFFLQCLQTDVDALDPKKVGDLRGSWQRARQSNNLFLHAEMQMAMFYALNPHLCPIQGFIGVNKKCCWCCDFVLKHLQTSGEKDTRYNKDDAGAPLFFSVNGTHNRKYTNLVFPEPSMYTPHSLPPTIVRKIRHRFKLVREDLEMALVSEVKSTVRELQKLDSSGMNDDLVSKGLWKELHYHKSKI